MGVYTRLSAAEDSGSMINLLRLIGLCHGLMRGTRIRAGAIEEKGYRFGLVMPRVSGLLHREKPVSPVVFRAENSARASDD